MNYCNTNVFVSFGQSTLSFIERTNNTTFGAPIETLANFTYVAGGWNTLHLRYLADVNGDGKADIFGFGNERVYVALGQADVKALKLRIVDL